MKLNHSLYIILISITFLFSEKSNAQRENSFSLSAGIGLTQIPIRFGSSDYEKRNTLSYEIRISRNWNKLIGGIDLSVYNYHRTDFGSPSQIQLVFNRDLTRVIYTAPFLQESISYKYSSMSPFIGYNIITSEKFDIGLAIGSSFIFGSDSRTRLTAEGDGSPTVVGYQKSQRSEIVWRGMTSLRVSYKPRSNTAIGISLKHQNVLDYWSAFIFLKAKVF